MRDSSSSSCGSSSIDFQISFFFSFEVDRRIIFLIFKKKTQPKKIGSDLVGLSSSTMASLMGRLRPDRTVLLVCDIQDRFRDHISCMASVIWGTKVMVCFFWSTFPHLLFFFSSFS